jgi:hypothetical protein
LLFVQKCKECSKICDFSRADRDVKAKATKTTLLKHLVAGFAIPHISKALTADLLLAFFDMVKANVFRPFPVIESANQKDMQTKILDAAWPHISLVYECLNGAFNAPSLTDFPPGFSAHFVDNCLSPDDRERVASRQALISIFAKYNNQRLLVRKRAGSVYESQKCTAELLDAYVTVVGSFVSPLKPDQLVCFYRHILPLHCLRNYEDFHRQLNQVLNRFISKSGELLASTVRYLQLHWPVISKTKQMYFIKEYEELMVNFASKATPEMFVAFFRKISDSFNDEYSVVARTALGVIRNKELFSALKENSSSLGFRLTVEINAVSKMHWDHDIRELALNCLEVMKSADSVSYGKATDGVKMITSRKTAVFGVCKNSWTKIVDLAKKWHPDDGLGNLSGLEKLR